MGDACNRDNYMGDRSSTRTFHSSASHHSKSSWSIGWGGEAASAPSVSANRFANGSNQNAGNVITDRPTTRLHAPPGGHSSIFATDDPAPVERVSANRFANGSNQNAGNVITDRPTTRLHAPPGGHSSIFATDDPAPVERVSANRFANGSNQNAGNVITDRPTTRLHAPPGGHSSIFATDDEPSMPARKVSSNAYASGSNQNAGNVLTDRPITKLHAPPGGRTSISLTDGSNEPPPMRRGSSSRDESPPAPIVDKTNIAPRSTVPAGPVKVSSNAYASGSNQNCGNVLTDRPTTRVHAPPGGRSSIFFG